MNNANKIRSAFNFIIKHGFCNGCCHKFDGKACHKYDCYENGVKVIRETLKKQIPMKPIIDEWKRVRCVNEHNLPVLCRNRKMPFCPFCGQAIDWSEDS